MSGPGDAASIWEALRKKSTQRDPDLEKDWAALCAAWNTFHTTMERHIVANHAVHPAQAPVLAAPTGNPSAVADVWPRMPPLPSMLPPQPPTAPQQPSVPPPAVQAQPAPGKSNDAQLAAREKHVLDGIQSINAAMMAEITRIKTLYMSGHIASNQVNAQMAAQYNCALSGLQLMRVEASALNDLGKSEALRVLDVFVSDTKKAIEVVGGMISQQSAFEIGISKVWQTTMVQITATQLGINDAARKAYDDANAKYFSKF